ncbi:MAG: hypothetical protein ACI8R1_002467, partial [Psychrobacter glaciei]
MTSPTDNSSQSDKSAEALPAHNALEA